MLCDDPLAAFFRMSIEAEADGAATGGSGGGGGGGGGGGAYGAPTFVVAAGDEGAGASKPSSSAAAGLLPVWDDAGLDGASGGAVRPATSSMLSDGGELLCSIWRLPDAKYSLSELGGVTAIRVGDALAMQACASGLLLQLLPLLRLHACLAPAEPSRAPLYPPPAVAPRALLEAGDGDAPREALTVGARP